MEKWYLNSVGVAQPLYQRVIDNICNTNNINEGMIQPFVRFSNTF